MGDGGYQTPTLWLSEGWATAQEKGWDAPLYWQESDRGWMQMTLGGLREVDPAEPVCHISFFEAEAFAHWAGARLPDEAEWELVASEVAVNGCFADDGFLHPTPAPSGSGPLQLFGDVWEWTRSSYSPYPGYRAAEGAIGEYNGKFMCNQFVLRGGACVTPRSHLRTTYRNFYYPHQRWQFGGIRLARDV